MKCALHRRAMALHLQLLILEHNLGNVASAPANHKLQQARPCVLALDHLSHGLKPFMVGRCDASMLSRSLCHIREDQVQGHPRCIFARREGELPAKLARQMRVTNGHLYPRVIGVANVVYVPLVDVVGLMAVKGLLKKMLQSLSRVRPPTLVGLVA